MPFAYGQHDHAKKVLVDGSQHPELVPDSVAFNNYFIAVATPKTPTSAEVEKQVAVLAVLQLSQEDFSRLHGVLAEFKEQFDSIASERQAISRDATGASASRQWVALRAAEDSLVEKTRANLEKDLSKAGWSALHDHVTGHVKRHIRIVEAPMSTTKGGKLTCGELKNPPPLAVLCCWHGLHPLSPPRRFG